MDPVAPGEAAREEKYMGISSISEEDLQSAAGLIVEKNILEILCVYDTVIT